MTDVAPMPGQQPAPAQPAPQGEGFFSALLKARATLAFIVAVVLVFVLAAQDEATETIKAPFATDVFLKYGGFTAEAAEADGSWWRLLTTLFVSRFGFDAIIFLWLFFELGPFLERTLGTGRYCAMFFVAGAGGVAIGELIQPGVDSIGTIVAVYALLGGIPGVVLGQTGSLRKTLAEPSARSALFWIALWLGIGWFISGRAELGGERWNFAGIIAASALAAVVGAGLACFTRNKVHGVVWTGVPVLAVLLSVNLLASGMRLQLPESSETAEEQTEEGEEGSKDPLREKDEADYTPTTAAGLERQLRERYTPGLDRFGPLPSADGVSSTDEAEVRLWSEALEKAVNNADSLGLTEHHVDDLRVRCLLVLNNYPAAAKLAGQLLEMETSPRRMALVGVAYYQCGTVIGGHWYEEAQTKLEAVVAHAGFDPRELPEVHFYLGASKFARQDPQGGRAELQTYLDLTADLEQPVWRTDLVAKARKKLGP